MCQHEDFPCCGCGPDLDASEEICPGCNEPENYCSCEDSDEADPGDMDGDFDTGMASAGFGTDEDYGCYDGPDCDYEY